jgi:hypothetical protein
MLVLIAASSVVISVSEEYYEDSWAFGGFRWSAPETSLVEAAGIDSWPL